MEIYVVTCGEYSDYSIYGVFTDKTKAENYVKIHGKGWCRDMMIETYEANCPEKNNKTSYYMFVYSENYELDRYSKQDGYSYCPQVRQMYSGELLVNVCTDNEEKAKKIAQDRIAEYKYRKEVEEKE